MSLLTYQRKLLLSCHQVAYIQFQRGRASDDYTSLLVVYVLVPRNCSWKQNLTIIADAHHKVITAHEMDDS